MTFTKREMEEAYAEHGNSLVMFGADGDGPYSANPADYFNARPDTEFKGTLAIHVPESYATIEGNTG